MTDMRAALYVYSTDSITFTSNDAMDFYEMGDDYSAKFLETITTPQTRSIDPGVYGLFYADKHGVEVPSTVTLVDEVQRKKPWPVPPPPPPPPFVGRRDWDDHTTLFMVPLGGDLDDDAPPG